MTSTAVVLGMAPLGKLWPASGCDCAKDRAGSTAISKAIMNFIGVSSRFSLVPFLLVRVLSYSIGGKKLLLSEALDEKVSRVHQNLLTPLRVRTDAGHHQHSRHAREQQSDFRLFFYSCLTGHERQEPLPIRFQQRLNPSAYRYRFPREFRPKGGAHATSPRRICVART